MAGGSILAAYTGKAGDPIKVRAHDDFALAGVGVAIRGTDGTVLEQGAAVAGTDGDYNYTATQTLTAGQNVVIEVTATDRPTHRPPSSVLWFLISALLGP